jgi:sigma54-dependent transcription regulator
MRRGLIEINAASHATQKSISWELLAEAAVRPERTIHCNLADRAALRHHTGRIATLISLKRGPEKPDGLGQ